MIYYVYNKLTGEFAGSGVAEINNDQYASTTTPPDEVSINEPKLVYNETTQTWSVF